MTVNEVMIPSHSVYLYTLVDTSQNSYGCSAFLKCVFQNRIEPIKQVTISCLQFSADHLATKVSKQIEK